MTAPITKHEVAPHADDDPSHPTPYLGVLDVVTFIKHGGANLTIVAAGPLGADRRSLTRLLDKIEAYLGHMLTADFQSEAGAPTPANTIITVVLHPDSAPEVHDLLDRSKAWVRDNNATLVVENSSTVVH